MKKEKLTIEQRDFINKNINKLSLVQIAEKLGLSYRVVYYYASKNTERKKHHKFTQKEDDFIRASYNMMRVESIAELLGLSTGDVYNRARTLNVRKFSRK